jgi:RNA polymerase sigma-70 factor, ECF subfamily
VTPRLAAPKRRDDVDLERDKALVERCQGGDATAFDDLYLRYYARLCRFCFRRLGDMSDAEDTAQEAFARAWKALPTFNGERRCYPWLRVIASHLCVDSIRRSLRTTPVIEEDLDLVSRSVDGGQEAAVDQSEDRELLNQALGRISPRHREVLQLRETYEWSYQRIAEHQGVQVSTIETLLFRARRSLRREFLTLAEGQGGLAGVYLILRKFVWKARTRLVPVSYKAPAVGATSGSTAAVGGGAAASFVATALVASAVAVVASLAPHPAAATVGSGPAVTATRVVPVSEALLPIVGGGRRSTSSRRTTPPAHKTVTSHVRTHSAAGGVPTVSLPTLPVPAVGDGTGPAKLVKTLKHIAGEIPGLGSATRLLQGVGSNLGKTLKTVGGAVKSTVHKLLKTVSGTVGGILGSKNPVTGLLGGTTGTGGTGNTGGLLGGL